MEGAVVGPCTSLIDLLVIGCSPLTVRNDGWLSFGEPWGKSPALEPSLEILGFAAEECLDATVGEVI